LKTKLSNIVQFQSGIYEKPDINADTLYLQAVHFTRSGSFNQTVVPQLKLNSKLEKHLLKEGDLLFAAKGLNNFAAVYQNSIGKAVASSSFIVIRIKEEQNQKIQPDYLAWYITHNKQIKLLHQQQWGTTIPSISMKQLGELEIDIPPVAIQKKIVAIHQLREKEKELATSIEEWKDKQIQLLLSDATKN
jgi:restriction endonuclease S subunit